MKILLVDDEGGFLKTMGEMLRGIGHDVLMAENGKQALELLDQQCVDAIISDVFMPTLDGMRFHDYVRQFSSCPHVPFVYMSGYDDEGTRQLVTDPSLDFFLSKTTPADRLLALLDSFRPTQKYSR
jgi:CheY-like chemotaxis protein